MGGALFALRPSLFALCARTTQKHSHRAGCAAWGDRATQVGGFLHTGLAAGGAQKGWNIAHNLSAYAVAAEKYSDVVAAV